jgi:hypothetical protein
MEDRERYSVVYIYIHKFNYKIKMVGEQFNFEPQEGKVYRCVYDKKGQVWRLPISESKGMVFSALADDNEAFECQILEFTYDNMKDIKLPDDEIEKIIGWESDPELNEQYLDGVLELMKVDNNRQVMHDDIDEEIIIELDDEDPEGIEVPDNFDARSVKRVMGKLLQDYMKVLEGKDGVALVAADLFAYLKTTYSDKYTDTSSPLDTKSFLYHPHYGTTVNMFSVVKYIKRYMTKGYGKSKNATDLYKAIHHLLFELARLKITEDATTEQKRINTSPQGSEGSDMESKDGSKDTPKTTGKRRGRPKKGSEGR